MRMIRISRVLQEPPAAKVRLMHLMKKWQTGLVLLAVCSLFSNAWANIEFLFLFKEKNFLQFGDELSVEPDSWSFVAGVRGDALVTGGTIEYPGSGGPVVLSGEPGNFSIDNSHFTSQAELDSAFPNGQMTLSITDNGATTSYGPVTLTGDGYVEPGLFLNLDALAMHDASKDFQIKWSSFSSSDPDDQVIFQIFDSELDQDVLLAFLPYNANSYTIPGGLLQNGSNYDMGIFFLNAAETLNPTASVIGFVTSTYTNLDLVPLGEIVTIPDPVLRQAVKLQLDKLPEEEVTTEDMFGLTALDVTSNQPLDLTGLQYASSLNQLALHAESITNFILIANLAGLEEVILIAPPKAGMNFTHWSDGSRENPRTLRNSGSKNFSLTAQYSAVATSPFAGGYALVANGTVSGVFGLPEMLGIEIGDPYELKFTYLILEEAKNEDIPDVVTMDFTNNDLLPRIAMEAEVKIGGLRWLLRTTNDGISDAYVTTIAQESSQTLGYILASADNESEYDFPYANGNEEIFFLLSSDNAQGTLFNGPAKIPDSPDYLNWNAVTGVSIILFSESVDYSNGWYITLGQNLDANQTFRLEQISGSVDLSQKIEGYSTDQPSAEPIKSTEQIDISWTDPYAGTFETTYQVWRGTRNKLSSSTLVASDLTEPVFSDEFVIPGQIYYYWIRAIRDGLRADYSLPVSSFRAIATPEDVQATQGDFSDRIRVSWTRVSGASSYAVYRAETNNVNNALLLQEGVTGTEFDDFSPATGNPYFYWVTSKAFGLASDFSAPASGYRVVNGITSVRASDGLYNDRVHIQWDAFPGATSYLVYRNAVNDSSSATNLASNLTATQYDDMPGMENQGVPFYYWVRPQTGIQPGSLSNTDTGYSAVQRNTPILAWGDNDFDQTNIPLGDLTDVVEIAAGANHSLALQRNGTVVGWGRNEFGQAMPPAGLMDVIDIAVGYDHSLALKRDGTVVAWGRNTFGKATVPVDLVHVVDIEAGAEHSLALLADGRVAGWGSNDFGQLAIPSMLTQVVQIAAGGYHNMVRRADGTVVVWGDNRFGQRDIPDRITQVIDIAAGWNHCLVLLPDGTVDGWGDNSRGQLDFPSDILEPPQAKGIIIRDPVTARIVDISGGLFHSLALSAKGELSAWGEGKNSQTDSPQNLGTISQIDAGDEFNLVVAESAPAIENVIPGNTTLLAGEDLVLKVRATGGPDISYQWYFNNQAVAGATGEALFLSNVSVAEKGPYFVKVASGGTEISSAVLQIDVTLNEATVTGQTVRAIKSYDGTYLFSEIETDPPGLELAIYSPGKERLPSTAGTYMVSINVAQKGYESPSVENATLILDTLNNEPLRLNQSDSNPVIRYFAPEGFSSTLQSSSDMREWFNRAKVTNGDGLFHDFNLPVSTDNFYRVVFEVP